jgi:hypothetical protein
MGYCHKSRAVASSDKAGRPVVDCLDDRPEYLVTLGDCRLEGGVQDLFHDWPGEAGGTQPVRGLDGPRSRRVQTVGDVAGNVLP